MQESTQQYWASTNIDEIGGHLMERCNEYYKYLLTFDYFGRWARIYKSYYIGQSRDARLNSGGDQGQFTIGNANLLHTIIRRILVLTITQRPAFQPRATNSDVSSQKQTILANQLLDYYVRVKHAERDIYQATEFAAIFGEGYMHVCWNQNNGELKGYVNGETDEPLTPTDILTTDPKHINAVHDGDVEITAHEPVDVIRDVRLQNYRSRDWLIVRTFKNKFDVAAQFPEYADEIKRMEGPYLNLKNHYRQVVLPSYLSDVVPVYMFYHSKSPALPDGRVVMFIENGRVLLDNALPYEHIPVYRISGEDRIGTPFGNSPANDLMPLQEAVDMELSTVLTNHQTFGVQNVMTPKGSGLTVTELQGGMKLVEYDPVAGKPEPLNLCQTPPEIFNMLNLLQQMMGTVSGTNSPTNPTAGLGKDASGAAMALYQSQAIEFNSPLQVSYAQLLEDFGTGLIQILKTFAKTKRILTVVGKANRSSVLEFQGTDLSNIERVVVETGNPMAKTVEGKMQIAQMLLQAHVITDADMLLDLLETGNIDPMIQGKESELLNIQAENESLSDGEQVPVILTDEHVLHIHEHKSVLADPSARKNPQLIQTTLAHIQQHMDILTNPQYAQILQLLGQPTIGAPPAQGQAPGQPGAPQALAPGAAAQPTNAHQVVAEHMPHLPSPPKNKLTGQPAPVAPGTGVRGS